MDWGLLTKYPSTSPKFTIMSNGISGRITNKYNLSQTNQKKHTNKYNYNITTSLNNNNMAQCKGVKRLTNVEGKKPLKGNIGGKERVLWRQEEIESQWSCAKSAFRVIVLTWECLWVRLNQSAPRFSIFFKYCYKNKY